MLDLFFNPEIGGSSIPGLKCSWDNRIAIPTNGMSMTHSSRCILVSYCSYTSL